MLQFRRANRIDLAERPARGTFTESEIQEFVDDFVMKLRTVKSARTKLMTNCTQVTQPFITTYGWYISNDGRHRVTQDGLPFLEHSDNIGTPEPT